MSYSPRNPNGQATMANSEPVVLASDHNDIKVTLDGEGITATNLDIRDLVNTDVVTAELSATDNAVLDAIAASTAAIDIDTSTIIGHVDGIEALLTTIDADTSNLDVSLSTRLKPADTLAGVTTLGTITNVVHVDDNAGSLTVDGSVTANAGTNLNTSALALESGGNLADIKAKTDNIPALGQALAAASVPVVLTAAQISTITPPAAITGFATSANQSTEITALGTIDTSVNTLLKPASTLAAVTSITNVVHIDDNGSTVSVDDGGGSITVDGTVAISGSVDTEITTADLDTGGGTDTRAVVGLVLAASGGGVLVGSANPLPISDNGGSLTIDNSNLDTALSTVNTSINTLLKPADTLTKVTTVDTITNVVHVDDNAGSLTVDGSITANAGTNLNTSALALETTASAIKTAVETIDNAIAGSEMQVDVVTLPNVTNAGTFVVQENGAALTSLQLIDDAIYTDGSGTVAKGIAILGQDGTNPQAIKTDSAGELQVDVLTMPSVAVTGTFWQATQPVSAASLPLPSGAATSALQTQPGVDIGDVTINNASGASAVNIQDGGNSLTVDNAGTFAVQTSGNVAHDSGDSGNPIKVGFKALSALPTAVTTADRANGISDLWGRQLTSHIDPTMQTYKVFNATTSQTGTDVWSPTSGKKIAITSVVIGTYATTAARLLLWFGDNADTTYTAGTDQLVIGASFAPSSTVKPGLVFSPSFPIFCTTANRELHVTTDAALSVDITVYGYEY